MSSSRLFSFCKSTSQEEKRLEVPATEAVNESNANSTAFHCLQEVPSQIYTLRILYTFAPQCINWSEESSSSQTNQLTLTILWWCTVCNTTKSLTQTAERQSDTTRRLWYWQSFIVCICIALCTGMGNWGRAENCLPQISQLVHLYHVQRAPTSGKFTWPFHRYGVRLAWCEMT